jgi:O-antigen/teichoic acid export membrane protein
MSRTGRAAKGFVTSVFQFVAQIAVQALLAPIVLKMAGRETLGAYAAVMQALSFITLTDFIGSWTLERFLGQASGLDDGGKQFRLILTTARTVFIFENLAFAILVFIFSLFTARLFHLSPPVAHQAQYALWVIAIWAVLRTPLAAYMNASIAMQDMATVNMIGTCLTVGRTIASLIFVLMGGGLFGLMLAGTAVEGCGYFLYRQRFKKKNPHLMPGWGITDKKLLKELLAFGGHSFFLNLGNGLIFNSGNTIAGMTHGAAMASSFYTTQMPATMAYNTMMRLADSATPAVNELWGRGETEKVRNALRRIIRLVLALTLPLAFGVLIFNRDLIIVWVGLRQYGGTLLTVSLAVFCVIVPLQRIAIVYSFVFGWMRLLTGTALVQGAANFALAFYFAKLMGLGGITLALVIVVLPQTLILWHRVGKFLDLNVAALLGSCFLRTMIPIGAAVAAGEAVHRLVTVSQRHVGGLLLEMTAFMLPYTVLAYIFTLADHDRNEMNRYLHNFVNRGKGRLGWQQGND